MARQEYDARSLLVLALFICASAACSAQGNALDAAKSAFARGDTQKALETLRLLRSDPPDAPTLVESLALSVQYSLATGDAYRAGYFLQRLLDEAPGTEAAFHGSLAMAEYYYNTRSWMAALEYYRGALDGFKEGASGRREGLDLTLLRCAELSLYHEYDPESARTFFRRIVPGNLPGSEAALFREMRVRLLWSIITPSVMGLRDANVSSLRVDGDDLWIGTWNGGVSRYSVSASRCDPFPLPAFTRSIEIADRRVWIGTSEGLDWYGKSSGHWGAEEVFRVPTPRPVRVVRYAAGSLYAGTLGDGLYRLQGAGWDRVSDGDLPGNFITCVAEDSTGERLFIGTMNLGLVILDLRTGAMSTLSEDIPGFTAENITTILCDSEGHVWIGTYGEGLFLWSPPESTLRRFAKATREIADDWVLSGCETDRALYFGTFGGGVSVMQKGTGAWSRLGIRDGLASLDIAAIAWRPPYVFFGTLGAGVSVYDEAADGAQP